MERTLAILNELERAGIIERYAIGGATGLMFYTEPMLTYDLDVFCLFHAPATEVLSLAPIYDFLRARGYEAEGEHVLIEGIPVQFLPAYNALLIEAVQQAETHQVNGMPTRVLRYEYLVAIMLQTGRPKDRSRLLQALEERPVEEAQLKETLERYNLHAQWLRWRSES